ncbi:hydantoinase/oxoprolinase family protein [Candidatus Bipolaricaulota bacterium]
MTELPIRAAVDIGGTFTDLVLLDLRTGVCTISKVPSTPPDYSIGVLDALGDVGVEISDIDLLIHGTTAHLNALLERKGATTALLTTEGFGDVYKIARGNRIRMYDLHYANPVPLIPRFRISEIRERIGAQGEVVVPLEEDAAASLKLAASDVEALAICLLHSYANSSHEEALVAQIKEIAPSLSIYPSFEICREWREYERTSTTVINAYVSPILASYLGKLRERLAHAEFQKPVFLMQSNGGLIESVHAERRGALTLMSGPVGGAVGCVALGRELDEPDLICIDMGGTSFDFGLVVNGVLATTSEREIAGFPLLAPSVDIQTIGAGGGSIAWLESGALRVGPRSAGAVPGPACYARGGIEPTVTDANVVLGRISTSAALVGTLTLSPQLAAEAMRSIAELLGLGNDRMAEGVIDVVNTKMANAIRSITIGRGIDPRSFALVAYGGAGPLHAAALAEELGIRRVIVPDASGVFSARGMLQADVRHEQAQTILAPLNEQNLALLGPQFERLEADLARLLLSEGIESSRMAFCRSLDMRYVGQEYFINVILPEQKATYSPVELKDRFDDTYDRQYGHKNLAEDIEIVNARVEGIGRFDEASSSRFAGHLSPELEHDRTTRAQTRSVIFKGVGCPTRVLERSVIVSGETVEGPAILEEHTCTTLVPPGWVAGIDELGNLILRHHDKAEL